MGISKGLNINTAVFLFDGGDIDDENGGSFDFFSD
jgi:hypothetical protein